MQPPEHQDGKPQFAKGDTVLAASYVVSILDVQIDGSGAVEKVKVRYSECSKWDRWLPVAQVEPLPTPTNGDKSKRQRTARSQPGRYRPADEDNEDDAAPAGATDPEAPPRVVPTAGSAVEVFDVREGWRRGAMGAQTQWGTVVRMEGAGVQRVHMPLDFDVGDVRWPMQQGSSQQAELEGKWLLVPAKVFAQEDDDAYAGIIKRANCRSAQVFFPIDGKEYKFGLADARNWLVEGTESEAEWRRQVPNALPSNWPDDVLFCSFPLQAGVDKALLKKLCALSDAMQGVEIKRVATHHPLHGTKFACGLYATKPFHQGHVLGSYAGCIGEGPNDARMSRRRADRYEGQFAISLDIAQSMGTARCIELDAKFVGNESRFINDYRGIAPRPNVEFCTKACARKGLWVDVKAAVDICDGDELLVNYGDEFTMFTVGSSD